MKKHLLGIVFVFASILANAQCTTTNATGCQCKDSLQTDCDLLPDIQVGHPPFYIYNNDFGIKEFSQSGNAAADNGKLYVTVSTPNTGHGPLELLSTDTFVCLLDTIIGTAPSICPDGITYPKVLIDQRIYHKTGSTMTHWDRPAGTMTYHPTHAHMHVDNWGIYTLRTKDTLDPNPLHWPIIGSGTKLAFCVEDYGNCQGWPDHCLDSLGNSLNSPSNFPNYGLGGGTYQCSSVVQGISSGYVDIYWTTLAGMSLPIPPNICNGLYYIVVEVDPNQNFIEEREDNNWYSAPFVLTKQLPNPASTPINVTIANSRINLCQGESVSLAAQIDMPNVSYHWSNGDTTQFTTASTSGTYTCDVTNQCGTGTSVPVHINVYNPPAGPLGTNDTIPVPGVSTVHAASPFSILWYDQPTGGTLLGTGTSYTTPNINTTTTYFAEVEEIHPGASFNTGLLDTVSGGTGGFYSGNQSMIFDALNTFILHSVKVFSPSTQTITIQLLDSSNTTVLQSAVVNVVAGANVVVLDFLIPPGINYHITRTGGDLYRNNPNNGNLGYPFNITNYCSITGNTVPGSGYYYFFYDWNVRLPDHKCTSSRTPVEAVVLLGNAIANVAVLNSLTVFPNPAKDNLNVSFHADDNDATIELIDQLGRVASSKIVHSIGGNVNETLNISSLGRGVYNIHILSSGKNLYKRILID